MKRINFSYLIAFILIISTKALIAQDTFSIVAVDTITGEIGSAGASCVGPIGGIGAFILSDVIEGVGGIHTQASYNATNQQNAHNRMVEGLSPQEIIDWLVANDAQGNPQIRQYGIVDLTRNGESAAYTGVDCLDYKNHTTDDGYSIQGNILLGQVIIDTMKTLFLLTSGEPLADRLMKTLEAAKILGADTRCASRGTSSQSSFLKVVRIGDGNDPYVQLVVPDSPVGVDPIDLLRTEFDNWKASLFNVVDPFLSEIIADPDTLWDVGTAESVITITPKNNSDTLLASGLTIELTNTGLGTLGDVTDLGNGTYEAIYTAPIIEGIDTISAAVVSGADTVLLFQKAVIVILDLVSVKNDDLNPEGFHLYQNVPNPFNPTTKIKFTIPQDLRSESRNVTLKVYDLLGNEITTLVNEEKSAGSYEVDFNAEGLPSGIYFYKLTSGKFSDTKKMLLLR